MIFIVKALTELRPSCCWMLALLAWALLQGPCAAETSLPQVVRETLKAYFAHETSVETIAKRFSVEVPYQKRAGVFVTLSQNHHSRACWGSLFPQQPDLIRATVAATLGALTKEYRYAPIRVSEWQDLKTQVTVIRALQPIAGLQGQNPIRDGLLIRSGGKSGLLLPGEATDATYQLVQCKLKAGIGPQESYQLYRIKADVYP